MWTIFDSCGKAIANSDFEPDHEDLSSRGARAVFHQERIPLDDIRLSGEAGVKRKPVVTLSAEVSGSMADIAVDCDDNEVSEIPLFINETIIVKPPGRFTIIGEPGVSLIVDFDRALFRGELLEVKF